MLCNVYGRMNRKNAILSDGIHWSITYRDEVWYNLVPGLFY